MAIKSMLERLIQSARNLRAANGANVSVTFALAVIPVVGFVGAAVDYSHANSVKTALQAAADSTALMLSKTAATLTSSQLTTQANSYLKALFTRPEATGLTVNATYNTTNGSQVVVTATADVPTNFMGLMGVSTMQVGADAQVKWGNTKLRVALVLDNTGSMADDGKMTALISATKSLLTQLQNAATNNGDVYVSVVPFVKDVNVGSGNYKANWLYWGTVLQDPTLSDDNSWDANNGSCSKSQYSDSRSNCTSHGKIWSPANHKTWNGCVMDRGNSAGPATGAYDTNVSAPSTINTATLYAAEQYSLCPNATVMGLNYDWSAMTAAVNGMSPNGSTNQTIGLQMGWQSLVGGGPFAAPPPMDPNYKYTQAIILLTDGLNTQDRWYGNGSDISTQVDGRMALTCSNAKAAGIVLYTVQVNTGGDPTSTLLKTCASDSSKFWMLTSANQIVGAFTQIGTALSNLRIAQ